MDFLDQIDLNAFVEMVGRIDLSALTTRFLAFDVPVPDGLVLAFFVLVLLAFHKAHRTAVRGERARLEAAYASELTTANRRIYQARSDLSKAQTEINHQRQKKRRAEGKAVVRTPRSAGERISQIHELRGANSSWG
ncbi:MAG: hypothetical protein AAF771_07130 [Pseudomonadota bacterium]